ncbi:hypothetical protein [Siphonobacter sp. BAB-5385]|uniref:hypothetical protein n=1 Tax=Siphonobacter sp. BAB-5385 TaxID=1864822 RepID=UPI0011402002|nr:hypothetical protein [Siphonobacter sp. BAB-5385]
MKKRILLGIMLSAGSFYAAQAQVKIGANPTTIQSSSLLELENEAASGNNQRGLQLPSVALTNTTTWAPLAGSPAPGMTVYNTNADLAGVRASGVGAYVWSSTNGWNPITDWSLGGNNISANQVLGTNNAQNLNIRANGANRISISAETGQTLFGGASMAVPRLYIARPAPGTAIPGLYVENSTGFNSAPASNIVVGNAAGNSFKGMYGFVSGGYDQVTAGQVTAGISYRSNGTLSLGVAAEPYAPGEAAADKLIVTSAGDVTVSQGNLTVNGAIRSQVTRVAVTNNVAGGAAGAPTELSNTASSYISLAPTAAASAYQVPAAGANAGLMLIIKNNTSVAATLSSAGGRFVVANVGNLTYTLDPGANIRVITLISDGSNWQITAIN